MNRDDSNRQGALADAALIRVGTAIAHLDAAMSDYRQLDVLPDGLTIRAPRTRNGEYLVVIRGEGDDGARLVAFHSATSLGDALAGLAARINNGSLKWRVDEYAR